MPPAVTTEVGVKLVLDVIDFEAKVRQLTNDLALDPRLAGVPQKMIEDIVNKHIKFKPGAGGGGGTPGITGGLSDMAAAGGVAGVAAAATLKLIGVLQDMVKQSKIANTLQDTINKALGLLIDLVLLPFLPFLIGGIIALYRAIMGFGKDWKDAWDTIKKEGLIGLLKLKFEGLDFNVEEWKKRFIEWWFSKTPGEKLVDLAFLLTGVAGGFFGWLNELQLKAFIDFLFGGGQYEKTKDMLINLLTDTVDGIFYFIYSVFGGGKNDLQFDIFKDFIDPIIDFLYKVFTAETGTDLYFVILNDFISPIIQWLYDVYHWGTTLQIDLAYGKGGSSSFKFPSWEDVSNYFERGIYGGSLRPSDQRPTGFDTGNGGGGGMNIFINGTYQNDEELYQKFLEKLRRDQMRWNV